MKKLLLLLLLTAQTFASTNRILTADDVNGVQNNQNLLGNSGWEVNVAAWTASGGTYTRNTTAANVAKGVGSASWDSNGAAQTFLSTAVAIPVGLYGKAGLAYCYVQTPSGTATHSLGVYDGSTVLQSSNVTSSTSFAQVSVISFTFPTSGNIQLRFLSVNANEPTIYIDDCFIGVLPVGVLANPMTTAGDIIYGGASGLATRRAIGTNSKVLKSDGSNPDWAFLQSGTTKSADYTVTDTDGIQLVLMTTSNTTRTVTLPLAGNNTGRVVGVKKVDSGTGFTTLDGNGSETIDGSLTKSLLSQYEYMYVQSDGSNWHLINFFCNTYLSATKLRSAGVSLTSATAANITAALAIPDGEWDLRTTIGFDFGVGTVATSLEAGLSQTSATIPASADTLAVPSSSGEIRLEIDGLTASNSDQTLPLGGSRVVLTATSTNFYLVGRATWTTSTMAGYGSLLARRIRP